MSNMDSTKACMKYIIFTFNFIIWCMGGAILGIGVWVRADSDFWEYHQGLRIPQFYQACYVAIVLGAIILLIGFFGCCGAVLDSPCMLFTYMLVMCLVLLLELAVAGLVWKTADGDKFQEFLTTSIKDQIELSRYDPAAYRFIELLQLHMECCGAFDKNDYHLDDIPQSCSSDRTNNVYIHGCGENIRRYLEQKAGTIGGVALGIGLMQFLGLAILSLGVKMKDTLESLIPLEDVPLLMTSIKAVIATGFFISVTGGAGFCGSCYEILWLIIVHLAGLGLIVVLEFSLGITLMVVKNTVEVALEETNCGETCHNIVMFVVTKLASASSGTMLTVIILQALMIYSAVQLYYYLRDMPKTAAAPTVGGPTVVVQNVQMQNVAAPPPTQQPIAMTVPAPQPIAMTVPAPQQPAQYGPQPSFIAPPPPYSEAQQSDSASYSRAVPQQIQSPMVLPPLDTSTLTRKAAKGDI